MNHKPASIRGLFLTLDKLIVKCYIKGSYIMHLDNLRRERASLEKVTLVARNKSIYRFII